MQDDPNIPKADWRITLSFGGLLSILVFSAYQLYCAWTDRAVFTIFRGDTDKGSFRWVPYETEPASFINLVCFYAITAIGIGVVFLLLAWLLLKRHRQRNAPRVLDKDRPGIR